MDKCIVKGCPNRKEQGTFVGDICSPCYHMITEGVTDMPSRNFIAELYKEHEELKEKFQKLVDSIS